MHAKSTTRAIRAVVWNAAGEGRWLKELQDITAANPMIQCQLRIITGSIERGFGSNIRDADIQLLLAPQERLGEAVSAVRRLRGSGWNAPLLLVTDATEQPLRDALAAGVSDFLLPPLRAADVLARLSRWAKPTGEVEAAIETLTREAASGIIIGHSPLIRSQIEKVERYGRCDATVLITGETGSGKEVFARAIHYAGPRASHPFLPVNCAALPVDLVENELFGHHSGAYTGARQSHHGMIEQAEGGTLFLDEIDSLPASAQAKLLRFLQEREYRPLGAPRSRRADVRIISASNRNLPAVIAAGHFRKDLFFRVNVLALQLPTLRERPEDIPELAAHFLARHSEILNATATGFSGAAMEKLLAHDWPGNIRELENVVERAIVSSNGPIIEAESIDLPEQESLGRTDSFNVQKRRLVADFERRYLTKILAENGGNITRAARAAEKNRRAFFQLIRKHKLTVVTSSSSSARA